MEGGLQVLLTTLLEGLLFNPFSLGGHSGIAAKIHISWGDIVSIAYFHTGS